MLPECRNRRKKKQLTFILSPSSAFPGMLPRQPESREAHGDGPQRWLSWAENRMEWKRGFGSKRKTPSGDVLSDSGQVCVSTGIILIMNFWISKPCTPGTLRLRPWPELGIQTVFEGGECRKQSSPPPTLDPKASSRRVERGEKRGKKWRKVYRPRRRQTWACLPKGAAQGEKRKCRKGTWRCSVRARKPRGWPGRV